MRALDEHLREQLAAVADWPPTELRRAAVLCPILPHGEPPQDHLLFVMRPQNGNVHAGQIAFPGGKVEGCERPVDTALRECREEVGLPEQLVTPLGELAPRTSTSSFHVHCIVGRVQPFEPRPDAREVERVLLVPLRELRDASRWRELPPPLPTTAEQPPTSPHFAFGADTIWGLTGRFVRELVDCIKELP